MHKYFNIQKKGMHNKKHPIWDNSKNLFTHLKMQNYKVNTFY